MEKHVTVAAVGDIMLGDSFYCIGRGVRSIMEKEGGGFIFSNVIDVFEKHDIVFGNLECVIADEDFNKNSLNSIQYRGHESSAQSLHAAHFSVMSVANNHILDHGKNAMRRTINLLEENGIKTVGLPEVQQRKTLSSQIINAKGIKIAFLAYCLNKERSTVGIVPDIADIIEDLRYYKNLSDAVIVSLHWGTEYMSIPHPRQISIAHNLIDSGADVILGHHPHVMQGIEIYKEKLIAYSLGNFVFNNWNEQSNKSMILHLDITKDGSITHNVIPVRINSRFQPIPLPGNEASAGLEYIDSLSNEIYLHPVLRSNDESAYYILSSRILQKERKKLHRFILAQLRKLPFRYSTQLLARPFARRLKKLSVFAHNAA